MLGYSHAEAVLLNLSDLQDAEDFAHGAEARRALLSARSRSTRGSCAWHARTARGSGATSRNRWCARPNGEPLYFLCVFHDVTERKAQQDRIVRLTRVQAVLSGINSLIVRVRDRQELFEGACKIAVEAGTFLLAWFDHRRPVAHMLLMAARAGDGEGYIERMPVALGKRDAENLGLNALAVADGQAEGRERHRHRPALSPQGGCPRARLSFVRHAAALERGPGHRRDGALRGAARILRRRGNEAAERAAGEHPRSRSPTSRSRKSSTTSRSTIRSPAWRTARCLARGSRRICTARARREPRSRSRSSTSSASGP